MYKTEKTRFSTIINDLGIIEENRDQEIENKHLMSILPVPDYYICEEEMKCYQRSNVHHLAKGIITLVNST